jgi:hypothetical protein
VRLSNSASGACGCRIAVVHERTSSEAQKQAPSPSAQAPARLPLPSPAGRAGPTPTQALDLQRSVGNRAAARQLARWAAHPDKDKKGQFLPDSAAADYNRFNPPKNE